MVYRRSVSIQRTTYTKALYGGKSYGLYNQEPLMVDWNIPSFGVVMMGFATLYILGCLFTLIVIT